MKKVILLNIIAFIIFSCSSKEKRNKDTEQRQNLIETANPQLVFEKTQDSLRNLLLKSKPNNNLKSSILQELYIRGLVSQEGEKISFKLPFNLHGLDCGAPDCYSTDISFEIPATVPMEFPDKINFKLHDHGCIKKEKLINSTFELKEESTEFVNYYSEELKSNLIIVDNGRLYYYSHLKDGSVKLETIEKMFENKEFEESETVPYQSTVMISNEYENFLKD